MNTFYALECVVYCFFYTVMTSALLVLLIPLLEQTPLFQIL